MTHSAELPVKPAPATGTDVVDAEHGVQLGLMEAAVAALNSGADSGSKEMLDQLRSYTQVHFMSEQLLMRRSSRPDYDGHLEDHERLLMELDDAISLLSEDDYDAARNCLESHQVHLMEHIRSWDRVIGEPAA